MRSALVSCNMIDCATAMLLLLLLRLDMRCNRVRPLLKHRCAQRLC